LVNRFRALLMPGVSALLCALASAAASAATADWPQWRGPDRTDVSKESGLLKTWPAGGPKRVWLFENAGLGYSGPAMVTGKLFTMGARDGVEYLLALDIKDGKQLWEAKIANAFRNDRGDGPRGTPAVEGGRVYALGGQGTLICANAADGKVLWQRTMSEFGGHRPGWGYSESVLVDGNKVLCTPGGAQGAIVALDTKTGEPVWQSKDLTDGAQYASIIPANYNGTRQYIQLTMKHITGVSAADGKVLWTSDWPGQTAVIPTPIFQDGQVYVSSGYGVGSKLVKIGSSGNDVNDVYFSKVMKNHHGGVVLVDGHLYGYSDGVGWVCQDFKTGEQVWAEKKALGKGAIAAADGMLYCLAEDSSTVVLIAASPAGWQEHGRFTLDPQSTQRSHDGKIWTHPVITGGRLYLRDQELLFCYDVKAL
jgi:outer membrane protein assembly factor BamB